MSKQNLTKAEIKRTIDKYAKIGITICMASIVGVILSPSIPITIAFTAIGAGGGGLISEKMKKLRAMEKELEISEMLNSSDITVDKN